MDLSKAVRYAVATEYDQWPKCHRCSEALSRPYPVEHFGLIGRERPRTALGVYALIIDVKCTHGCQERARLEKLMNVREYRREAAQIASLQISYGYGKEQRIRVEIPSKWTGDDSSPLYRGSAIEQAALSRIYAFVPAGPGKFTTIVREANGLKPEVH